MLAKALLTLAWATATCLGVTTTGAVAVCQVATQWLVLLWMWSSASLAEPAVSVAAFWLRPSLKTLLVIVVLAMTTDQAVTTACAAGACHAATLAMATPLLKKKMQLMILAMATCMGVTTACA